MKERTPVAVPGRTHVSLLCISSSLSDQWDITYIFKILDICEDVYNLEAQGEERRDLFS